MTFYSGFQIIFIIDRLAINIFFDISTDLIPGLELSHRKLRLVISFNKFAEKIVTLSG